VREDPKIIVLADWLDKQASDGSLTDGRIWRAMAVSERTFYRLKPKAQEIVNSRAQERQRELQQAKTRETIQQAKNGLKTKADRLMIYQKQIDASLLELDNDELDTYERVALRKSIKELQSEISKIEGDYAPIKQAQTDSEGNDIDYSKLSSAALAEIIKATPVADLN
jgi:hypothetical protein